MGDWECIGGLPGGKEFQRLRLAVSDKPDTLHLFSLGQDQRAYHKFFAGGAWGPRGLTGDWECIGGVPGGLRNITAVSDKPDTLHIFGDGNDSKAYHKFFAGAGWAPGGLTGGSGVHWRSARRALRVNGSFR